ncbi:MAG: MurR/RpiR family transcriptional regulator [Erysipelotrichaceae bacterium]|nr:MurR/RpiR family transcriptional regulator [Erysipelotrichaceae bacterium]
MNFVLEILLSIINDPSQSGINYDITKIILNNLDLIDSLSINELADLCFVSPATISRFCRFIGCNGFADFKEILSTPTSFINKTTPFLNDKYSIDLPHNLLNSIYFELETMSQHLDYTKIDSLVEDIYNYSNVAIIGRGNSNQFAKELQFNLAFYKKITLTFNSFYDQINYISNAKQDTLIIIITVSGQYLLPYTFDDTVRELQINMKNTKAKIICITKNPNIISIPYVNDFIQIGELGEPNFYNYSLEFIIDLISIKYDKLVKSL